MMNRSRKNKINKFVDVVVRNNGEYVDTVANIIANSVRFSDRYSVTYVDRKQLIFDCKSKDGYSFICKVAIANNVVVAMKDGSNNDGNDLSFKFFKVNRNTKVNEFADWLVNQMDEFLGLEHKECYLVEE